MLFGPASPDLLPGARNAVDTCLAIQPGERVALIADEASREVAASLERALAERGARARRVCSSSRSPRGRCRRRRAKCSRRSSRPTRASCACSRRKASSPRAWPSSRVVERRRIRYAHMVGVTPRIMCEGMRADYRQVDRLSQQLCERMRHARTLDGADGGGHQLHGDASIARWRGSRRAASSTRATGRTFRPAKCSRRRRRSTARSSATARPATTSTRSTAPSSRTPLVLEIRGGRLVVRDVRSHRPRADFWAYCHTDANSDRVGELAFGTNLGLREMIGILLQDEKVPGVHLAFGDPYGSQTHADWTSTHARRRPHARLRRLDRRRSGDRGGTVSAREIPDLTAVRSEVLEF